MSPTGRWRRIKDKSLQVIRPGNHVSGQFAYRPLPQKRSVRLLHLHPGLEHEPLRCSLKTVDLDADPEYEAISYVWGDPSKPQSISCDGRPLPITESIFTALRRFRYTNRVRILWADAICIDQENHKEKGYQVTLMHDIYRNSACTLVWLGHDDEDVVRPALSGICQWLISENPKGWTQDHPAWSDAGYTYPVKHPSYYWHDVIVERFEDGTVPFAPQHGEVAGLSRMCSRTWFKRGWVIQELASSFKVHFFWGYAQIDVDWISLASRALVAPNLPHDEALRSFYAICHIRRTQIEAGWSCSFHDLIVFSRNFDFSDPRDRIYGLLGLHATDRGWGNSTPFIEPDYGATVLECYQRVAEKMLLGRHNPSKQVESSAKHDLKVLSGVQHTHDIAANWPSWVPDWSQKRRISAVRPHNFLPFHCRKSAHVSKQLCASRTCICIDGFTIDVIGQLRRRVSLTASGEDGLSVKNHRDFLRELASLHSTRCLAYTFGEIGIFGYRETRPDWTERYRAFMQMVHEDQKLGNDSAKVTLPLDKNAMSFWEAMRLHTKEQTVFTTTSGRLGLGPNVLREGDVVVYLFSATTPYILRPMDKLWRLVGSCYIYEFTQCSDIESWNQSGGAVESFRIY